MLRKLVTNIGDIQMLSDQCGFPAIQSTEGIVETLRQKFQEQHCDLNFHEYNQGTGLLSAERHCKSGYQDVNKHLLLSVEKDDGECRVVSAVSEYILNTYTLLVPVLSKTQHLFSKSLLSSKASCNLEI